MQNVLQYQYIKVTTLKIQNEPFDVSNHTGVVTLGWSLEREITPV